MTAYRIILDDISVSCNYPNKKHIPVSELPESFVRRDENSWYHYLTETEFKKIYAPNLFRYVLDPLLKTPGTWDEQYTNSINDLL